MTKLEEREVGGGALRWRAPECFEYLPRFESDIYSFGMCIYEAFEGGAPYVEVCDDETVQRILNGNLPIKPEKMPSDVWELVLEMTKREPAERISLLEVIVKLSLLADEQEKRQDDTAVCSACNTKARRGSNYCTQCGVSFNPAVGDENTHVDENEATERNSIDNVRVLLYEAHQIVDETKEAKPIFLKLLKRFATILEDSEWNGDHCIPVSRVVQALRLFIIQASAHAKLRLAGRIVHHLKLRLHIQVINNILAEASPRIEGLAARGVWISELGADSESHSTTLKKVVANNVELAQEIRNVSDFQESVSILNCAKESGDPVQWNNVAQDLYEKLLQLMSSPMFARSPRRSRTNELLEMHLGMEVFSESDDDGQAFYRLMRARLLQRAHQWADDPF